MIFPRRRAGWLVGLGLFGVALVLGAIRWQASRALEASREEVRSEDGLRISVRPFVPPADSPFDVVSSPAVLLQAARFQERMYLAGPAGLAEYDLNGNLTRQFHPGSELPSSPLVAIGAALLADAREPELLLATEGEGLLAYNGRSFRQLYPEAAEARGITAILPVSGGHLLIATKKSGVLIYDGRRLAPFHPTLRGKYVTALAGDISDLWIGTLNEGVLHWRAGTTESFSEEQGLPDRQVLSLAVHGAKAYVGTALGVALFDAGRFQRVVAPGVLARAIHVEEKSLLVGTEDQGLLTIPLGTRLAPARFSHPPGIREVRQFIPRGDGGVYALARNALYERTAAGGGWRAVLQPAEAILTDRNVSALAFDATGRLWVGYFDRGLDMIEPGSRLTRHIENDRVFCINRILPDARTGTVAVATANGLIRFSSTGSAEQVLTRADGLIADHVTDVVPYRDGLAIATPAGVTLLDSAGARSLYAFHGLVNNHVYALAAAQDQLLIGTLGGISVLAHDAVRAGYTTANSGLKHNWITALVRVDTGWMVGTYGAGVLGLDAEGRFAVFDQATAPFEVNPNAMLVTARFVLAGSQGKGIFLYDRRSGRWTSRRSGLPSANVTALAAWNGFVYVGTDNGLVRIEERSLLP